MQAGGIATLLAGVVAIAAVIGAFVWGLLRSFAWMSGWTRLAARFPAPPDLQVAEYRRQTVLVGIVRYKNCMTIGVGPQGLLLRVFLPGHAPLFIPWAQVAGVERVGGWNRSGIRLTLGPAGFPTVVLPTRFAELIAHQPPA